MDENPLDDVDFEHVFDLATEPDQTIKTLHVTEQMYDDMQDAGVLDEDGRVDISGCEDDKWRHMMQQQEWVGMHVVAGSFGSTSD